jgi:hypothetical protein
VPLPVTASIISFIILGMKTSSVLTGGSSLLFFF